MDLKDKFSSSTPDSASDYTKFSKNADTEDISADEELINALRSSMELDDASAKSKNPEDFFFDDDEDEEAPTAKNITAGESKPAADVIANIESAPSPDAAQASEAAPETLDSSPEDKFPEKDASDTRSTDSGEETETPPLLSTDTNTEESAGTLTDDAAGENALTADAPTPIAETAAPKPEGKKKKAPKIKKAKAADPQKDKMKKILLGIIAALLAVAICLYIKVAFDYKTHFLQNTSINGFDVSGKTVAEVEQLLSDHAKEYQLTINFRNGVTETIKADDIDYQYVPDDSVQEAMDAQNYFFWPSGNLSSTETNITAATGYDPDKLATIILAYPEMQAENMEAPTDAHVLYQDGSFMVAEETYGTQLDTNVVVAAIVDAVQTENDTVNVEDLDGAYAAPTVFKDNEDLIASSESLNKLCNASITYDLTTGTKVLDGNTLKDWLVVDDKGNYTKDETVWNQHIEEFVQNMKDEVEKHTFNATGVGQIDMNFNAYSCDCAWSIDKDAEVAQLTQELADGTVTEREPVWSVAPFTLENGGYGYDQVEIDISRQHLWVYLGGEMVYECDFVSGANTEEKHTPSGIYKVAWKERNHVLRGEQYSDGSYAYETPCSYWMPFITDIGIGMHDATWQSAFGGERYKNGYGSHGCINLSMTSVSTIYDLVDAGTPVICYYSEGCDFE